MNLCIYHCITTKRGRKWYCVAYRQKKLFEISKNYHVFLNYFLMSHSSRAQSQNDKTQMPEFYFDNILKDQYNSMAIVHSIIEELITSGAKILHMKYIQSQIKPYASRTLSRELVLNASWALAPIDMNVVTADSDDNLDLPPIDEWAGGVLPVRSSDSTGLRVSVTPQREVRRSITTSRRAHIQDNQANHQQDTPLATSSRAVSSYHTSRNSQSRESPKKKEKPPLTEAQVIMRTFEEAKKKTSATMKAVTVDSDFSVIQISEPKGLPPALIVPKVGTKKSGMGRDASAMKLNPIHNRNPVVRKAEVRKKKQLPKLLEPDTPIFDDVLNDISYSDKFICAPGVTFKDGNVVKSRPPLSNSAQMTRQQYEEYLAEMKRMSD